MKRHDNLVEKPLARSADLVSERFDDGRVIYDERTHEAHSLRSDVATIWDLCDGHRSPADIAGYLRLDPEFVQQALVELAACDLLEAETIVTATGAGFDRRTMLKRTAAVGGGAALIATTFVPPAFAFGSTAGSTAITYTVSGTATIGAAATGTSSGTADNGSPKTINTAFPATGVSGSINTYCDTKGDVSATAPSALGYVQVDLGNSNETPVIAAYNHTSFAVTVTVVSNSVTIYGPTSIPAGGATPSNPYIMPTPGKAFTVTIT